MSYNTFTEISFKTLDIGLDECITLTSITGKRVHPIWAQKGPKNARQNDRFEILGHPESQGVLTSTKFFLVHLIHTPRGIISVSTD